jgi:nucleotide-binding universal stress UspA family protein
MDRIVVGVDGSAASKAALAWAIDEARRRGDSIVEVVHSWDPPVLVGSPVGDVPPVSLEGPYDEAAHALVERAVAAVDITGVEVEKVVLEGPAGSNLCERSAGAALLVVGSSRHSALMDALTGSVSRYCTHHAQSPVIVVPRPHDH